jgi:hypothetical protein
MGRIDFTEEDLQQFKPVIREAILRLQRQQEEARHPEPDLRTPPLGIDIIEHKTHEDFDREWKSRYKNGAIWHDPPP